jgi:hypothetical protein
MKTSLRIAVLSTDESSSLEKQNFPETECIAGLPRVPLPKKKAAQFQTSKQSAFDFSRRRCINDKPEAGV